MFISASGTEQLTATVSPNDTTDTLLFSSSDESVASVDSSGLVTIVGYGTAIITASAGSVSATCNVLVSEDAVESIEAVYTQSKTIFTTDDLDVLKSDLVVTANGSNGSTSIVNDADYSLSGSLVSGTSTITVTYRGKTATFNVIAEQSYLSSTGMRYSKNFTFNNDGIKYLLSDFKTKYGEMEYLEELTLSGIIHVVSAAGDISNDSTGWWGTNFPNLKKLTISPDSIAWDKSYSTTLKFGHYAFTGIPASLTNIQFGKVGAPYSAGNNGYFRNDGIDAGLTKKTAIGNTNGLTITIYTDEYKANAGFMGTVESNTVINEYSYIDGTPLTE